MRGVKVVLWPFEIIVFFQEIHNLQSKKTDVGELQKEREEAMQRLQVSCPLADGRVCEVWGFMVKQCF